MLQFWLLAIEWKQSLTAKEQLAAEFTAGATGSLQALPPCNSHSQTSWALLQVPGQYAVPLLLLMLELCKTRSRRLHLVLQAAFSASWRSWTGSQSSSCHCLGCAVTALSF